MAAAARSPNVPASGQAAVHAAVDVPLSRGVPTEACMSPRSSASTCRYPACSCFQGSSSEGSSEGKKRNRKRERGVHLSSYTGLIQVLPGHPLADPSSRLSRTQHQDIRDTNEGLVENTCNGDIRIHPSDPKEQEVIYTSVPALSSD